MTHTLTPEGAIKHAIYGWIGAAWHKLSMVWGYSATWDESLGGAAVGATYTVNTAAIPAGEVWVLHAASMRNNTRAATDCQIWIAKASGAVVHLVFDAPLTQFVPTLIVGTFALVTGDTVNIHMSGTVAGDAIQAGVTGYKMRVAA